MELVNVKEDNRELVNSFIRDHWCTTEMALRGKLIDMTPGRWNHGIGRETEYYRACNIYDKERYM